MVCVSAIQIETVYRVEVSNNKTHEHACQIALTKYYPTATLYYVDLYQHGVREAQKLFALELRKVMSLDGRKMSEGNIKYFFNVLTRVFE